MLQVTNMFLIGNLFINDSFPPGCDKPELIQQFLSIGSASWILNIVVD